MIQNCPRRCPGLATPLSDLGNVLAISPMLYVQLRLGEVASPALVDSGAGDNFIESGLVSPLQLKPLHLAVPTIIRSANGRPMDTYVVLVLPGFESVCHGFFTVCWTQKKQEFCVCRQSRIHKICHQGRTATKGNQKSCAQILPGSLWTASTGKGETDSEDPSVKRTYVYALP